MADNVTTQSTDSSAVPLGTIIATEDSGGGVQVQRVKITWGVDGTCTNPTSGSGLPVKVTGQSSNLAIDVNTLPAVTLSSGTQTIGTVLGNFSLTSSTIVIGAVNQGTNPWVTSPSSIISVNQGTNPWATSVTGQMGWLSSSTSTLSVPVIGQVAQATTPWNIANISNPIGWLSSSTSTAISSPPLIGSVAASTIWTVNQGSPPWSVSLTSGSLALGTVTLSSGTQVIGAVNQGTSPWVTQLTSGTLALGTVTSILTSGTLALGTVTLSSGTQVIGAVNQGTNPWVVSGSVNVTSGTVTLTSGALALGTVTLSSGTQVIGAVNQGTNPWTVALTSGTLALGTVTLSSGALALGTVTLSSGTQKIGSVAASTIWTIANANDVSVVMTSGTALTPNYGNVTTSSTLVTLVSTTAAKVTTVLSMAFSVNSTSTAAAFNAQLTSSLGSTDKTYSSKFFFPTNGVSQYILPYNPIGWAVTTSSGNLSLQVSAGVTGPGLSCLFTYVSQ